MSEVRDLETIEKQIRELYSLSFNGVTPEAIAPLPVDMSPRRYFRVTDSKRSLIAMIFDSVAVPEAVGSGEKVDSFQAVLRLTEYLLNRGVSVPKVYGSSEALSIILEDDFGDVFLADRAKTEGTKLYKKAIDQIISLQQGKEEKEFFALKRGFSTEVFYKEMEETPDYYLSNLAVPPSEETKKEIKVLLRQLAERVGAFSQTLSLRDFHSWNIMVRPNGELGIIDFQDALQAPRTYDVVSLLNDRDTDQLLGEKVYDDLLEYFYSAHPNGSDLRIEYPLVLLQRDLKVAGRLSKMIYVRGLPKYAQWVPGTVSRISRTLLKSRDPLLSNLHSLLAKADPGGFGA
jgi:aminoglycoside/choline kinase family phosphotransferase